jgi:hypothetical protein
MNTTIWTGLTLTILGIGGLTATEATLIAVTMTVCGIALLGLGVLMRQAGRAQATGAMALGVVLIGLLDALNSFGRTLSADGLTLSQPIVLNIAMAMICSLYLALWGWEHQEQRRNRRSH